MDGAVAGAGGRRRHRWGGAVAVFWFCLPSDSSFLATPTLALRLSVVVAVSVWVGIRLRCGPRRGARSSLRRIPPCTLCPFVSTKPLERFRGVVRVCGPWSGALSVGVCRSSRGLVVVWTVSGLGEMSGKHKYVEIPDPDDPDVVPPSMAADTPYSRLPDELRPEPYPNRLPSPRLKKHRLSERQQEYIEWLCTPPELRVPSTARDFFRERGMDPSTGRDWRQAPYFVKAWNQRLRSLQVDPANIDAVLTAMRERALAGDVRAQTEWLKIAREFYPTKMEEEEPDEAEELVATDLSDEELEALIAGTAQAALEARRGDG